MSQLMNTNEVPDQFVVDDKVILENGEVSLMDPEFDQIGFRVAWQDRDGNLWVTSIEAKTGQILIDEAIKLDSRIPPIQSIQEGTGTGNGPEWIYTQNGSQILYTIGIDEQWSLGKAYWKGNQWESGLLLGGEGGHSPIGTQDLTVENPLISYFRGTISERRSELVWGELDNLQEETVIPEGLSFSGGRWVEGKNALILTKEIDGVSQVFLYDVETEGLTQLTFSTTEKNRAFMWQAPEFNNDWVFLATEKENQQIQRPTEVGIYRNINGKWTKFKTIKPSFAGDYNRYATPFVFNGKSYLSLLTGDSFDNDSKTEVWIAGIDPEENFYRRVSDSTDAVRNDPEPFITTSGVFIYYQNKTESTFHLANTGLGLPEPGNNFEEALNLGILAPTATPITFANSVDQADQKDYFRFQLLTPATLELNLSRLEANLNLFLGNVIGEELINSQNRGNTPELITTVLESGIYTIWVSSDQQLDNPFSGYDLTLSTRSIITDGAGNTPEDALDLGFLDYTPLPKSFSDYIGIQDDIKDTKDYYRFELQSSSLVTINLDGLSANANLFLADQEGIELARSDQQGNTSELITYTLDPGTYSVLVRSNSPEGNPFTDYDLTLFAKFIVDEVIVSNPEIPLPDPEFDQRNYQVTWQDLQENLWVAPVDSQTGNFILEQAIQLDSDLAPISSYRERTGSGNGPEWIYDGEDSQILYTKFVDHNHNDKINLNEWYVGRSQFINNNWQSSLLPQMPSFPQGNNGLTPIGSLDENDPNPRVLYLLPTRKGANSILAWRDLNQDNGGIISEQADTMGRWVNNESSEVVYPEVTDGISQVFLYDISTDTKTQLTFNSQFKDSPFMWKAPEFNDELILMTVERTGQHLTTIGIYRQIEGQWIQINTIRPPSDLTDIRSAEPFVFENNSYISFVMENEKGESSEVWISGVNPNEEFYRQVSDPNVTMVRNDPESFVTDNGVIIYYTQRGSGIVYGANTGLIPSTQNYTATIETDPITGNPLNDSIVGDLGNDSVFGDLGNDSLDGNVVNDLVDSGLNHDLIQGGIGLDSLTGGVVADTVLFNSDLPIFSSNLDLAINNWVI